MAGVHGKSLVFLSQVVVARQPRPVGVPATRAYAACAHLLERFDGALVTSPLVIAEAAYLINRELGPAAATDRLGWCRGCCQALSAYVN